VIGSLGLAGLLAFAFFSALPASRAPLSIAGATTCEARDAATFARAASDHDVWQANVVRQDLTGDRGELTGYVLTVGLSTGRQLSVPQPPESFVAEQVGNLVVYGHDSPATGSEVHAVDVRSGCHQLIARPEDVVRSAVIDAGGQNLYVHSVSRAGRSDQGVARHDLSSGQVEQVIQPIRRDPALGRGWETALLWNLTGTALAVEPCTMMACQTRILDVASGSVRDIRAEHGPTIAFTDTNLFTFGAGDGWPTEVLKIDFHGSAQVVASEVISASVSRRTAGELMIETISGMRTVTP